MYRAALQQVWLLVGGVEMPIRGFYIVLIRMQIFRSPFQI